MLNRKQHNRKICGGFTLIEAIVTVTIIAIVAAVVVPSGIGFIKSAGQSGRNKTARNIFLAAQKAMSSENASGLWDSSEWALMGTTITGLKGDSSDNADGSNESGAKADMRYMKIDKNSENKDANSLFMLLDRYVADKEILDNSILIEYNATTRKVVSAFYSDVVDALVYRDSGDGCYNISARSDKALKKGRVGFYGTENLEIEDGADYTSDAAIVMADYDEYYSNGISSKGYNINNGKNYGLLTVEILLPEDYLNKKLELEIKGVGSENYVFDSKSSGAIDLASVKKRSNVSEAIADSTQYADKDTFKKMLPSYIYEKNGRDILVLILDCQDSSKLGMVNHKNTLGCSELGSTLKVYKNGSVNPDIVCTSNKVHSMFSDVTREGGKLYFGIKSARHLNNLRLYAQQEQPANYVANKPLNIPANENIDNSYIQLNDIYCRNYNNDILSWKPIGTDKSYSETVNDGGSIIGFIGHYKGEGKKIYDLAINLDESTSAANSMTGLFTCITTTASVDGVYIDYSDSFLDQFKKQTGQTSISDDKLTPFIYGNYRVGAIAGENWGTITNCTVRGRIGVVGNNANGVRAGGIVGKNMRYGNFKKNLGITGGVITNCRVIAKVSAKNTREASRKQAMAGGIAGENFADIIYCEVGTGVESSGTVVPGYFGADSNMTSDYMYSDKCVNDIATVSAYYAGGIAGVLRASAYGDDATVKYCVNASHVRGSLYAGGLTGYIENYCSNVNNVSTKYRTLSIESSYNAGTVESDINYNAGGICAEALMYANYTYGNNKILIKSCYNTGSVTGAYSAGILSKASKRNKQIITVSDCYNAGDIVGTFPNTHVPDGIYYSSAEDAAVVFKNCVTLDTVDTKLMINETDTAKLSKAELAEHSFDGMVNGTIVKPFEYPFPHFNVTDAASGVTIGNRFHRTPWK